MRLGLSRDEQATLVAGQRTATFRFELLGREMEPIGDLAVSSSRVPTMENNTNRTIKRQLNGLYLHPVDAAEVNPITDRVRVSMILGGEHEFPLGVFLFSGYDRTVTSGGTIPAPTMHDQGVILDQGMPTAWTNQPGTGVVENLERLLDGLPLPFGWEIETTSTYVSGAGQVWPAGTSRSVILNETASLAGFYAGYFDNRGVLRFRSPQPTDDETPADFDYDSGPSRVASDSIVISDDLLDAPNRYIVVDTSSTDRPLVGVYDVPATAPQSSANRGFVISRTYDAQGLTSEAQARQMAEARYAAARGYEWLTFDAAIDPRHDTYDTVRLRGVTYRSQSWSMRLEPSGQMRHQLRRTYAA